MQLDWKFSAAGIVAAVPLLFACLLTRPAAGAEHAHLYAGVLCQTPFNPTPGEPLWFANGSDWETNSYGGFTQSPACIYFDDNLPAVYPGQFQTATTFAALAATIFKGGPSPYAASLGTYIELRIVSLHGPAGGVLTLWNERPDPNSPTVILAIPVGTANGTNQLNLSEGDPSDPESDPYGHIHGRRFTLNKPGLYTLGLQLLDTSGNGPGGGPIHTASSTNYFYLQAGLWLSDFSRSNNVVTARFGLPGYTNFVFEASPTVPGTNWVTIQTVAGTDHSELRWVRDLNAVGPTRFYRIRTSN